MIQACWKWARNDTLAKIGNTWQGGLANLARSHSAAVQEVQNSLLNGRSRSSTVATPTASPSCWGHGVA